MTQAHLTPVNALEKNATETQVKKKKDTLTQQRNVLRRQQKCAGDNKNVQATFFITAFLTLWATRPQGGCCGS